VSTGGYSATSDVGTVYGPSITSFSPTGGTAATVVTISGSGFASTSAPTVTSGSGVGSVTSWGATQITVQATWCAGVSQRPLSVAVNGSLATSAQTFRCSGPR